jgi:channel protein (hemolysin III family)
MPSDPFSAYSHLIGFVAFAILTVPLVKRARANRAHPFGTAVFAASTLVLLGASTLFHTLPHNTPAGDIARRLDHAAIFVLIAGTFVPIHLLLFRGILRWGILVVIWVCAGVGIALKLVYFDSIPGWLHVMAYVGMGWLGAIGGAFAVHRRGVRFMAPIGVAAVAYTGGAMLELAGWPVIGAGLGPHEVFHVGVLVGLGAFWVFIWRLAGGNAEPVWWRAEVKPVARVAPIETTTIEDGTEAAA